ncbi:MAG TPA: hypothetical protein VJZ71_15030 [Phycisphaerae bacterium]|nr:hypothetical protein [Phycisphaerae bacterium]
MAKLLLYLDSSVWNAYFDDHVPDIQAHTRAFFERIKKEPEVVAHVSDVVFQEMAKAPQDRKTKLVSLIGEIQPARLELDDEAGSLADAYIQHGVLRMGHLLDARHVAIATVSKVGILVSWNYRHLVNRRRREAFNGVNAILGYPPIEILSPPEVFDE